MRGIVTPIVLGIVLLACNDFSFAWDEPTYWIDITEITVGATEESSPEKYFWVYLKEAASNDNEFKEEPEEFYIRLSNKVTDPPDGLESYNFEVESKPSESYNLDEGLVRLMDTLEQKQADNSRIILVPQSEKTKITSSLITYFINYLNLRKGGPTYNVNPEVHDWILVGKEELVFTRKSLLSKDYCEKICTPLRKDLTKIAKKVQGTRNLEAIIQNQKDRIVREEQGLIILEKEGLTSAHFGDIVKAKHTHAGHSHPIR